MAAMNRPKTNRGQLILATGFTIAVVLVALVVLLNTVIYTENLATRGVDAGGADAIEYRATVVGSVGELIDEENERFYEGVPPVDGVGNGIGTIDEALAERHLTRGAVAESELKGGADGITTGPPIVWQDEDRNFTDADGDANWTVATDTTDIERFVLTVEPAELTETEEPFRLVMDEWSMEIDLVEVENETNEVNVTTENGSNTTTQSYGYEEVPLEIDLVNETIGSENRSGTDPINPAPPSNATRIEYENGDRATGTFELRSDGTPDEGNLTEYGGTDSTAPFYTYLVESVDLAIHYETAELRYTTEATVTAGESA